MRGHRLSHLVFDAHSVNIFLHGIYRNFLRPVFEIVFAERDGVGPCSQAKLDEFSILIGFHLERLPGVDTLDLHVHVDVGLAVLVKNFTVQPSDILGQRDCGKHQGQRQSSTRANQFSHMQILLAL